VYGSWLYATLPKREFPDPESVEEFRNFLQQQFATYKTIQNLINSHQIP
jgi:hypothetical protein